VHFSPQLPWLRELLVWTVLGLVVGWVLASLCAHISWVAEMFGLVDEDGEPLFSSTREIPPRDFDSLDTWIGLKVFVGAFVLLGHLCFGNRRIVAAYFNVVGFGLVAVLAARYVIWPFSSYLEGGG
jgi:hypothetical protein